VTLNFSFDHLRGQVKGERRGRPEPDAPFRILVAGDFSGRGNRGQTEPLLGRAPRKADIDTFETLMRDWKTRIGLAVGTKHAFGIGFGDLESFHPDEIYQRVEMFGALRDLRKRLVNPKTSAAAAQEVRAWGSALPTTDIEAKPPEAPSTPQSEFESLLGGSTGSSPTGPTAAVDAIIRDLISPHILPAAEPDLDELVSLVDRTISEQMRSVLHDRDFAQLEANWRGLHQMITGLELGEELDIFALDVSRDELKADICDNSARGLTEIFAERGRDSAGGRAWSVVCLLEHFGANEADAQLVGGLGMCAHAGGAMLLAGACDDLAGVDSIAAKPRPEDWTQSPEPEAGARWQVVRSLPESASVGLALPRVLVRLPYCPRTDPIEAFEFDECPAGSSQDSLLWGNSAVIAAILLGRAFTERGWSLDGQAGGDVDGLPVYVPDTSPDRTAIPCAEAWLTDSAATKLLGKGLIPVLSVQHHDAVRVPRLISIAGGAIEASWA
jgi:type VI secretion system protein ImpC